MKITEPLRVLLLAAALALQCHIAAAALVTETLHINRGTLVLVDSVEVPYLAFNSTPFFSSVNARLIVAAGDNLELTVVNNDTVPHGFDVKNYGLTANTIAPGDSMLLSLSFAAPSVHIYYDALNYPNNAYMGLAGMLVVTDPAVASADFYWNIKELQTAWNDSLAAGGAVNWTDYYPNYFTVNGRSNPEINNDPAAKVTGSVGDTIHIYMVNTGQAVHSIHFHGYHCEILYSTARPGDAGRHKDTFATLSMEALVLELVPHQPGEYPVHDHNLVAVSGGNIYPNGMFLTLNIQ